MRPFVIVIALVLLSAGCVTLPGKEPVEGAAAGPGPDGSPEARQEPGTTESVARCPGDSGKYCATKTVRIERPVTAAALDVALDAFNGAVRLEAGPAGKWTLEATLSARGNTEAAAVKARDAIKFEWRDQEGGRAVLHAEASVSGGTRNNEGASLKATVPAAVLVEASLQSSNGPVDARGITAVGLVARTSNGPIVLDIAAQNVAATTSNGPIDARITPRGDGSIGLDTTNGPLMLVVPETANHGYDATAKTTNGQARIALEDGTHGNAGGSKTFRSAAYDERDVRTVVKVSSTNGPVEVSPS